MSTDGGDTAIGSNEDNRLKDMSMEGVTVKSSYHPMKKIQEEVESVYSR